MRRAGGERLARGLLWVFGIGFALLGLRFFIDPRALTGESDIMLPTAKAIMEIRTVYGGMFAGLGVALCALTTGRATIAAGLRVLILVAGIVAVARIGAITLGQAPDALFAFLLAVEIAGVVLALVALRAIRRNAAD